ncbi:FG-GAP-like repeat-containing protein [Hymenobacter sp. ASUV-10]|uniref:FG-GAP-like repeat-containing protein n=1 Tax=Hymenobacter aranciens TaxID=3063996 RepID=A0ABT9B4H9_9BACT|nr:FG-GAP-like repeat-containing protein [Hymenobacter sp. ASUV-10]MDO7873164.1 FG-GAP-like repeat-containing protein [Hymenobacter sp. ASUV-10]
MNNLSSLLKASTPALTGLLLLPLAGQAQLNVSSRTPARNAIAAPRSSDVTLTFDQALDATTAGNVRVFSAQRGGQLVRGGNATASGSTLTVAPANDFQAGENVQVTVPATVLSGTSVAASKQVYQFTAAATGGSGTFVAPATEPNLATASATASVVAADVNGDGRLDILAANVGGGANSVTVRLNNGDGTYATSTVSIGIAALVMTVADVNGDGALDLLVANGASTGLVAVRLNDGSGSFSGTTNVPVGNTPQSVAAADLDGDGDLDLLAGNYAGSSVSVRFNDGTGGFSGQAVPANNVAVGGLPQSVVAADMNGDGALDILTANRGAATVSVRLNDGNGSFPTIIAVPVGNLPYAVVAVDVDGNGTRDIATSNFGGGSNPGFVSVRFNDGSGTFTGDADPANTITVGVQPYSLTAGDIDGDGDFDLLTANGGSATVSVLRNSSSGSFAAGTAVAIGGTRTVVTADVDGDGDLDLLTASNAASVAVRLNQAAAPTLTSLSPTSGPVGASIILTGTGFTSTSTVSFNGTAATSVTFTSATSLTAVVPTGATTGNVTVTTVGGTTSGVSFTVTAIPSLVISTPQNVAPGTYQNITVQNGGSALLQGDITVLGTLQVQAGGRVQTIYNSGAGCATISGSGNFVLEANSQISICSPDGISASGATGSVQVTGTRTFSPQAFYLYDRPGSQITGAGLPAEVAYLSKADTGTLTLSQAVAVRRAVEIFNAGGIATNGQALTLLSDANGTALLANYSTGQVTGNVTVQRYIDGSQNAGLGYRHLAVPVDGQTVAAFASGGTAQVVNDAYNTATTPGLVTPFPTVYRYSVDQVALSPATSVSDFDKGWISPASLTDNVAQGNGRTVQLPGASTLSFTGAAFQTATTLGTNRPTAAGTADWIFFGNPYASPLDFSTVQASQRTNLDAAVYVFESSSQYGGGFRSYVNGVGGNALVGSSQGFWVRMTPGQTTASLALTNANRVTSFSRQAPVRRSAADVRPQLTLALAGNNLSDDLTLYAEAGATAGVDAAFDAAKMPNSHGLNLAALAAGGEALAIDGRADFATATAVPLTVGVPALGAYAFTATALANLPAGTRAELADNLTNTRTVLTAGASYAFTMSSFTAPGRFWLNLMPAAAPLASANAALEAQVLAYPNPAHGQLTVLRPAAKVATAELLNSLGQRVRSLALPTAETVVNLHGLAAGVYTLRLTLDGQPVAKRVVVE